MAFPSDGWFKKFLEDALENTAAIDMNADTFKCALYTNSATGANLDTDLGYTTTLWGSSEVVGSGYTAGGATCATPTVAVASGVVTFDAGDAAWTTATITARGGIVYDDTLTAGSKYGIVALNFGSDKISTAGNFTVQFAGTGILTFT